MIDAGDEYYLDMLDGLAVHLQRPLLADLSLTISRLQPPGLGYALNANQVRGKKWLIDTLAALGRTRFERVLVLGGWYAVLPALLLDDPRFDLRLVTSLDVDPGCQPVAESLNRSHVAAGRFRAVTADMLDFDYAAAPGGQPDLIVNTSCEHLPEPGRWLAGTPPDTLLVLQSNDYSDCDEHLSCVADESAFQLQMPLARPLFSGARRMKRYTRVMQIGYRGN